VDSHNNPLLNVLVVLRGAGDEDTAVAAAEGTAGDNRNRERVELIPAHVRGTARRANREASEDGCGFDANIQLVVPDSGDLDCVPMRLITRSRRLSAEDEVNDRSVGGT
jgi:hypothetical protein